MVLEKLGYVKKGDYNQLIRQIQEYKDKTESLENELRRLREEIGEAGRTGGIETGINYATLLLPLYGVFAIGRTEGYVQRIITEEGRGTGSERQSPTETTENRFVIPNEILQEIRYEQISGINPLAELEEKALIYMGHFGLRMGKEMFLRDYMSGRLGFGVPIIRTTAREVPAEVQRGEGQQQ